MHLFKKLLFLTLPLAIFASYDFQASLDMHYSPYVGKDVILSSHESIVLLEGVSKRSQETPERGLKASFYRMMDCALFWDPLCYAGTVLQHEVFGHGYRIRSLKEAKVLQYSFGLPPPFGKGGGATSFATGPNLTLGQFQSIGIGGFEGEDILSREIKKKFIKNRTMSRKLSALYIFTRYSPLSYSFVPWESKESFDQMLLSGNDIENYLATLAILYPNQTLEQSKLSAHLMWNLCDAMTFYHFATGVYYIFTGKDMHVPMIPLGKELSWLPNISVKLAPYGLESYVENFFLYQKSLIYMYVKAGRFQPDQLYFGFGVEGEDLWSYKQLFLGMRLEAWMQPNFLDSSKLEDVLEGRNLTAPKRSFKKVPGGSVSLVTRYGVFDNKISFFMDIGYKTKGYLPGYALQASPITRVGISGKF